MRIAGKTVVIKAHQASYRLHHGAIPDGLEILHSCDNPPCVHPIHLLADTHAQNMIEAGDRGLMVNGEAHPWTRLSNETIAMIRTSPLKDRELARHLGVNQSTVWRIRNGKRRRHS